MDKENQGDNSLNRAPEAIVKSGRSLSIVWVVPIVAMLIGGWLALKAWSEKGPEITITFESAEGLEANKTKIKFKDVEVGKVTSIELSDNLSGVIVTAEMNKSADRYMRDQTEFWVVRARVVGGEVSGLGTLFSGAYIGCNPSLQGTETNSFTGLEKPPVITTGVPGRHYVLLAESLGSLDVGSPVYYRGIKVGQVVEYDFDASADALKLRVFVNAPYHEKVQQNSRFWNASGVDFKIGTEGMSIDTQSLVSIVMGGIAFDLPKYMVPAGVADEGRQFRLYKSRERIEEQTFTVKHYYMMYFDQNVRGLLPGAPVEIRGIQVGEVVDVNLEVNVEDVTASVAVLTMIEPERIDSLVDGTDARVAVPPGQENQALHDFLTRLVEKGLRAQLKTGNLLTGQLYVDLDFLADAKAASIETRNGYLVLPTLPAPFEQIAQRVNNLLKTVEKLPLEEITADLRKAISSLNNTLQKTEQVAGGINAEVLPDVKQALEKFQATMDDVGQTLGPESALNINVRNVMSEMTSTIRSLRALIDYVERNPQSILFGKEAEQ